MNETMMKHQTKASACSKNLRDAVIEANSDYQVLAENIAQLQQVVFTDIDNPLPIVISLIETLSHAKAATLRSEFKVPMMKILAGYCNAMFFKSSMSAQKIDEKDKLKLLDDLKKIKSLLENDKEFKNIILYYCFCAESAVFLLRDNHEVDWVKHGINIAQTAGSYFTLGSGSKLGELGGDFAEFAKKKIDEFMTWKKYEQVLMIVIMQIGSLKDAEEFEKTSEELRKRVGQSEKWEIIYTHMEVLEIIYLRTRDIDVKRIAFKQIREYGSKQSESIFRKISDDSWRIREKAYHFIFRVGDLTSPFYVKELKGLAIQFIHSRDEEETNPFLKNLLQNSEPALKAYRFIDNNVKTKQEKEVENLLQDLKNRYKEKYSNLPKKKKNTTN
eukprot:TRINITY_DN2995_c0_g2_i1.p1 TRINITY_DN2995_c0_g2~~TRINITY_DN2995_c0_g2_i1.p1  ORF type:complete len:387 (+),score=78.50 TRINITY_DN2995_c0_g2_i1:178-1338(+)